MSLDDLTAWFADAAHWQGPDGIPVRLLEHVGISAAAVAIAAALALPVAFALGHSGRGGFVAVNVGNIGRALPSMALLGIGWAIAIALGIPFGPAPALIALVPLAIPPVLVNAYVGIRGVDPDVVEAARGMGLSEAEILRRIELPLALPLVLDGTRIAAVNVVATATLWALVAGGALGRYIVDGLALQEYDRMVAGALLVALLAIGTELLFGLFTKMARHTWRLAE
jgi:osmoprotectant transport system permease protein